MNFFIGANGNLFGWPDTFWLFMDQIGILMGNVLMLISILAGILAWIRRDEIRHWLVRNRFPDTGEPLPEGVQYESLLLVVSRPEVPLWLIDRVKPKYVALLASENSLSVARQLEDICMQKGIRVAGVQIVKEADSVAESKQVAAGLLASMQGFGSSNMAVDITGGKKPMSLGAFMAAEEAGCDCIYVSTHYDNQLKKPRMNSARICRLSS